MEEAHGSSGPELLAPSFSLVSGGSRLEEVSGEALGMHGCEPSAELGELHDPLPEALGGGGLLGGADDLWMDAALLLCSAPWLDARGRRTATPAEGCSLPASLPRDGAGEHRAASSWDLTSAAGEAGVGVGPLQAGRGSSSSSSSSSSEELVSDCSSSTSSSFKDSSLSQLSSPPASDVSSSPLAETDSLSLVAERA